MRWPSTPRPPEARAAVVRRGGPVAELGYKDGAMDEAQSERWDQLVAQAQACWGHDAARMLVLGTELVGLDPEEAYGYQVLAAGHMQTGELDAAEASAATSLTRCPDSPFAHYLMGLVYTAQCKEIAAERHFMRCIELDPEDPDPHVQIGEICVSQQDYEGARDAARRALALDHEHVEAHLLLGQGTYEDSTLARDLAVPHYEQAIACDPEQAEGYAALAALDLAAGRLREAEQGARAALRLEPNEEKHRVLLARVLRRRNMLFRALWKPQQVLAHLMEEDNRHLEISFWVLFIVITPLHVNGVLRYLSAAGALAVLLVGYFVVLWPANAIFKHLTRARVLRAAGEIEPLTPQARPWHLVAWIAGGVVLVGTYVWLVLHPTGRDVLPTVAMVLGIVLALVVIAGGVLMWRDARRRLRRNAVLHRIDTQARPGSREGHAE